MLLTVGLACWSVSHPRPLRAHEPRHQPGRMTANEWSALDTWLQEQQQSTPVLRRLIPERTIVSGGGRRLPLFDALSFAQLGICDTVTAGLSRCGFEHPTVVQAAAFGPIMEGNDAIVAYPPGTGKTLAYCLPLVSSLLHMDETVGPAAPGTVRAIVLVPSPELARQTVDVLRGVAYRKLRVTSATGGNKWQTQRERTAEGLEVLVATFGRLQAHLRAGSFSLSDVKHVVLDEADMVYAKQDLYASWTAMRESLPEQTAVTLVTSTLSSRFAQQATADLPNAKLLRSAKLHVTRPGITERLLDCSEQGALAEDSWDRQNAWDRRVLALTAELQAEPFKQALVLCSSVGTCTRLQKELEQHYEGQSTKVASLHSGLSYAARAETLEVFARSSYLESEIPTEELALQRASPSPPVLIVSTDRSMRGLDLPALDSVFFFDFPREGDEYVRSIGKAIRGDRPPAAVTFLAYGSQLSMAKAFMSKDEREEAIVLARNA